MRLAIGGPHEAAAQASAVLTDLLASSGVQVARTGSVVLEWPNAALPEPDLADAFARLHGPGDGSWETPVDELRGRVADWLRAERLRLTPPWPDGRTCAVALVHEARPFPAEPTGLRGRLRRGRGDDGSAPYRRIADVERACGAASALRSVDLLEPAQQAQVRALGFALDTPPQIRIAARPGYRRGTAFPTRGFDAAAGRPDDWVEIPLLGESANDGLPALLAAGGGAALAVPVERFAGEDAEEQAAAYADLLERLAALGAWLTTPAALVRSLYA